MLTNQQLKWRKTGIGGSEVASLFGCGFLSRLEVWKLKNDIPLDKPVCEKTEMRLKKGSLLEPMVCENFIRHTSKAVVEQQNLFKNEPLSHLYNRVHEEAFKQDNIIMFRHPDHPFLLANVDGLLLNENAALECKTIQNDYDHIIQHNYLKTDFDDEMPKHYYFQCIHYALVLGLDKIYFHAMLDHKNEYLSRVIDCTTPKVKKIQAAIIKRAQDFWENYVLTQTPPPPETKRDCIELFPEAEKEKMHIATVDIEEKLKRYLALKDSMKATKIEIDAIQDEITTQMKDAALLMDLSGTQQLASFKNRKLPAQIMQKQLREAHPDIYQEFSYQNETRVFLPKRGLKL